MTQTLAALKTLYVALGGSESTVASMTISADVINAIATQAATAIAKELPTVTAADNGKVLKVVNGKWAKGTDEIQA